MFYYLAQSEFSPKKTICRCICLLSCSEYSSAVDSPIRTKSDSDGIPSRILNRFELLFVKFFIDQHLYWSNHLSDRSAHSHNVPAVREVQN